MKNKVETNEKNNDSLDEANDSGLCEESVSHPNNFNNISKVDLKSLEDGQWVMDNGTEALKATGKVTNRTETDTISMKIMDIARGVKGI